MDKIDLMKQIGKRVRHNRVDKKISQSELADIVDCNDSAIARIESGKRMMSIPILLAISEALDISSAVRLHSLSSSMRCRTRYILCRNRKKRLTSVFS